MVNTTAAIQQNLGLKNKVALYSMGHPLAEIRQGLFQQPEFHDIYESPFNHIYQHT